MIRAASAARPIFLGCDGDACAGANVAALLTRRFELGAEVVGTLRFVWILVMELSGVRQTTMACHHREPRLPLWLGLDARQTRDRRVPGAACTLACADKSSRFRQTIGNAANQCVRRPPSK